MSNVSSFYLLLLNDYGVSYYYYYIHPIMSFTASGLSLICTIVLACKELRSSGPFFKYSLVNSASASISTFVFAFLFLNKCGGSVCSLSESYWVQFYQIYGIYLFCSTNYFAGAIIQIAIGVQLYLSIKRRFKSLSNVSPYKVCIVAFSKYIFSMR